MKLVGQKRKFSSILQFDIKHTINKKKPKIDKLDFIKMKTLFSERDSSEDEKTSDRYGQTTHLTKDCH